MKKQLLILLLALMAAVSALAYDFEVDGIYYNINGSEATVTSGGSEYSGIVTIPASVTYDNVTYCVTSINNQAFYDDTELKSVIIPNSVTAIGNEAFYNCTHLTSVTIGNSVSKIGEFAFYRCESLYSITIPESVTSIGRDAFSGTRIPTVSDNGVSYIGNILIEASSSFKGNYTLKENTLVIADFAFFNCSGLTSIEMPYSLKAIGKSAFDSCTSLSSVTISKSVETIDEWAFGYCTSLNNIDIPNSVTIIGRSAFNSCTSLETLNIPNSITEISQSAFAYCTGLKSLTIPESVTVIGTAALCGCSALVTVTIPSSVLEIREGPFEMCSSLKSFYGKFASADNRCLIVDGTLNSFAPSSLTTYVVPNSVTSIGERAFSFCSGLTSVTIPNSVTSIGSKAFLRCTGLTSVSIPNSVTSIGIDAFWYCSGLTSVTIPNSVTSIGGWAFRNCGGLTEVTIPNSVTSIGHYAFYDCTALSSIKVDNDNPANISLGSSVFSNVPTSTCVLNVPKGSKSLYAAADQWSAFSNIEEFETSGIEAVSAVGQPGLDAPYYDLMGRRVENPAPGVYIRNGRKVLVK